MWTLPPAPACGACGAPTHAAVYEEGIEACGIWECDCGECENDATEIAWPFTEESVTVRDFLRLGFVQAS